MANSRYTSVRTAHHLAVLALAVGIGACSEPVKCTFQNQDYDVELARDLPPGVGTKLQIEVCIANRCTTSDLNGVFEPCCGLADGVRSSDIQRTAGNSARLLLVLSLHEGKRGSTTTITVRAKEPPDSLVLDAVATVEWTDVDCHPAPVQNKI